MPEWATQIFRAEFGTTASGLLVFVFASVMPFCAIQRRWPDLGLLVMMMLSTAGIASGAKIIVLTLSMPLAQLGPLADDKPALMIGGVAILVLSLREAASYWCKLTGVQIGVAPGR